MDLDVFVTWATIGLVILVYFLPSIIAVRRGLRSPLIYGINLFLGWLLIPWLLAFFMATLLPRDY